MMPVDFSMRLLKGLGLRNIGLRLITSFLKRLGFKSHIFLRRGNSGMSKAALRTTGLCQLSKDGRSQTSARKWS
jgi:hypothetical protein